MGTAGVAVHAPGLRFPNPDGWGYGHDWHSHVIWDVQDDGSSPPATITIEA
jgi:hypothetical protein